MTAADGLPGGGRAAPDGPAGGGRAVPDGDPTAAGGRRARFTSPTIRFGVVAAALAALALLVVFGNALGSARVALEPGAPAPTFSLEAFDGSTVSLDALRGQVVVLNFWASWCKECGDEAGELEALWQEYGSKGVVFLGVDYTDTRPAAEAYIRKHGLTYPHLVDKGGEVSHAYRLTGVPETAVIDRQGRLVGLRPAGAEQPQAKIIGPIVPASGFGPDDMRSLLDDLVTGS
jgi:cytochrome c biogenesis protein CcmG/thiol:disulfide interchange protein DsbE